MANSIRVRDKDLYIIEVNDNGDTISLSKGDVDLPLKFQRCYDDIRKIMKKLEKIEFTDDVKSDDELFTTGELDNYKTYSDCYNMMRKAMDNVLGVGACQKIFGDSNWITMFDDLFEQLKPHLEAMGVNKEENIAKAVEEKYSDKEDIL